MALDVDGARTALAGYRYRTECASLLEPLLARLFYRPLLAVLPRGLPANALTAAGFVLSLGAAAVCVYVARVPGHDALLLAAAALLLGYHVLDNVDGAQARRAGTNGPVGELLDHGLDAISVVAVPFALGMAFGLPAWWVLLLVVTTALGFWLTMWELFRTGVMVTGRLSDVEALVVTVALLTVAGALGRQVLTEPWLAGLSTIELVAGLALAGFGLQAVQVLRRVAERPPLAPVVPVLVLLAWLGPQAAAGPPPAWTAVAGLVAARSGIRLIVDRLRGASRPRVDWLGAMLGVGGASVAWLSPAGWPGDTWWLLALLAASLAWELGSSLYFVRRLARPAG